MSANDDFELDADARGLLSAMREASALPPALHERVWTRLEESVVQDVVARPHAPWRRIAVLGLAAAAAILIVVGLAREDAARVDEAQAERAQAAYEREGGEAREGVAGAAAPTTTTTTTTTPTTTTTSTTTPTPTTTTTTTTTTTPTTTTTSTSTSTSTNTNAPSSAGARRGAVEREDVASSLAQEIAVIEKIRRALLAEAPARALEHVRAHARRFPEGVLAQEREALRVVATCALGDAGAEATAGAFIAAHPDSPLVGKVRAACATAPEKTEAP